MALLVPFLLLLLELFDLLIELLLFLFPLLLLLAFRPKDRCLFREALLDVFDERSQACHVGASFRRRRLVRIIRLNAGSLRPLAASFSARA